MEKFLERRASPRLTINLPAVVERKGPSGKVTHEQATLVNLGAQGAYVLSRQRFDPGDRIRISLCIVPAGAGSPGTHLILTGRVLRREPNVAWKQGKALDGIAVKLEKKKFHTEEAPPPAGTSSSRSREPTPLKISKGESDDG